MQKVKIMNTSKHPLPNYQTNGSAGVDLRANLSQPIVLQPMERTLVATGIYIALPVGYEAQIRPRSGLAIKHGISLINCVGTIDSDYRGEIKIPLVNLSDEPFTISDGQRIAQLILAKYEIIQWEAVQNLETTQRGKGGFGSTGRQ